MLFIGPDHQFYILVVACDFLDVYMLINLTLFSERHDTITLQQIPQKPTWFQTAAVELKPWYVAIVKLITIS